jgi:hypothetical protein
MPDARYAVERRGITQAYSEKRVRNSARRMAARMAFDGLKAKVDAGETDDPAVQEACVRLLEDLARRGRVQDGDDA